MCKGKFPLKKTRNKSYFLCTYLSTPSEKTEHPTILISETPLRLRHLYDEWGKIVSPPSPTSIFFFFEQTSRCHRLFIDILWHILEGESFFENIKLLDSRLWPPLFDSLLLPKSTRIRQYCGKGSLSVLPVRWDT